MSGWERSIYDRILTSGEVDSAGRSIRTFSERPGLDTLEARPGELTLRALSDSNSEIGALRNTLAAPEGEVSSLASTISAVHVSASWRITGMLRAARRLSARLHYSSLGYPLALSFSAIKTLSLAPLRDWRAERVIARSGLFDNDWYLKNNPDVAEWHINPVRHYVVFGAKEWRDPSPSFSTRAYLSHNPDLAAAEVNPLAHFLMHGAFEDRRSYRALNTVVQNHGLSNSSTRPCSATIPHRIRTLFVLKIKYYLKRVLGSRMSVNLSHMLARMQFGLRKLRHLGRVATRAENSLDPYKESYLNNAQHAIVGHSPHYGSRAVKPAPTERCDVQLIAYYLPQYHPIPENDRWWGHGFTEWRNVARAFPVFVGHDQPRFPGELGYYDLRVPQVMRQQIELAKLYGISAFCFHFYWFGGKRLLELPIETFLRDTDINFKFCLCWANENWTRRWDGADQEILIAQSHSAEDDVAFIRYLKKYFDDPRYLRIDGKPVLTVYRPGILPNAKATVKRWRAEAKRAGFPGVYLIATNSFGFSQFQELGFDALSEFPPHGMSVGRDNAVEPLHPNYQGAVYSYVQALKSIKAVSQAGESAEQRTVFPGLMPCWDNTPRQPLQGNVFHGSTPNLFYEWLLYSIARARRNRQQERKVFINAWNEWAEGAYLEPDRKYGYSYLAACAAAISDSSNVDPRVVDLCKQQREHFKAIHGQAVAIHLYYEDLAGWFAEKLHDFGGVDIYITVPRTISWEAVQRVRDSFGSAYILEVANRGRDICPFFAMYPRFLEGDYDFVCKLHSKKSLHLGQGEQWRLDIVGQLLSPAAKDALAKYQSKRSVGILAARGTIETLLDPSIRIRSERNLIMLAKRLGYEIAFTESFVAGSMFWFRPSALRNLYQLFEQGLEFEPELGQVDGTLAHAIERIVCIAAKVAGASTREFGETPISRPTQWA